MALDLEEQEQVDELKALWKKYGAYITRGVIAFFVLYALFQGWGYYQTKQSCWEDPKVTGIVPELPKIPTPPPLPPIKTSAMFSKFATDDQPLSPDSAAADWRSDIQRGRTLNTAVVSLQLVCLT